MNRNINNTTRSGEYNSHNDIPGHNKEGSGRKSGYPRRNKGKTARRYETTRTRNTLDGIPFLRAEDFYTAPIEVQERQARERNVRKEVSQVEDEPRAPNTGLAKSEALSIIDEILGKDDPMMMVLYDTENITPVKPDEAGFIYFARSQYKFLESLDSHTSDYMSEVEFTSYSVDVLRAFQLSRGGNMNEVKYSVMNDVVSTLVGSRYPKIYDEYFKNLGEIVDRDGHKYCTKYEPGDDPVVQISGSAIYSLVTVAHDRNLYQAALDVFVQDDNMYYLAGMSRGSPRRWATGPFNPGRRLDEPFDYIDSNLISNVNIGINRLRDKYSFEEMTRLSLGAPQPAKNKAVLIYVDVAPGSYLFNFESRYNDSGSEIALAALFQFHTSRVDIDGKYPLRWRQDRAFTKNISVNIELILDKMFEKMTTGKV